MGVFASTRFCDDSAEAWQPVNLTEISAQQVAEGQPRLTLVVDGLCLFHVLFEEATCPELEWIAGRNDAVLAAALESYVLRLRQGGVDIVVVSILRTGPPR